MKECLHCAIMATIHDWISQRSETDLNDVLDALGEVAGHSIAVAKGVTESEVDEATEVMTEAMGHAYRRYREEIARRDAGERVVN
jgi:hypothetical protein